MAGRMLPEIVLLAAGASLRFGSAKQLADIDGVAMVRHCAVAALATGAPVTVVTGAGDAMVAASLAGLPLALVHNSDWRRGIGSSIACGMRALQTRRPPPSGLLLHLADLPGVATVDLERMVAAWRAAPDRVVAAGFGNGTGPPVVFPQRLFAALAKLDGDRGARDLVAAEAGAALRIPIAGAACDIDTPADMAALAPE